MNIDSIVGVWLLIGSVSINSEINFIGEEPDPKGVTDWLNDSGEELIDKIQATSGLTLSVSADRTFTEVKQGSPSIYWFSDEGVLESEVIPFNGVVKTNEYGAFLQPEDIPSWATPTNNYGVILRYDDGDTKISDHIYIREDKLVRTINVVTDELYLDRIVVVYENYGD
ncbi:hypothetical protein ACR30L_13755 [Psychromonas sp. PT13]|uniref:hypothetical protein n=1 Tax=Psychromonas sp. PT13 TaxID=3439547 RepID=UPI003EB8E723